MMIDHDHPPFYHIHNNRAMIRSFDRVTLPLLFVTLKELRWLAIQADLQLLAKGEKTGRLEDAARTIMRAFNFCLNDRYGCFLGSARIIICSLAWGCLLLRLLALSLCVSLCITHAHLHTHTHLPIKTEPRSSRLASGARTISWRYSSRRTSR